MFVFSFTNPKARKSQMYSFTQKDSYKLSFETAHMHALFKKIQFKVIKYVLFIKCCIHANLLKIHNIK